MIKTEATLRGGKLEIETTREVTRITVYRYDGHGQTFTAMIALEPGEPRRLATLLSAHLQVADE
jgi:hypothetical protein